jgi:hypothetical protein
MLQSVFKETKVLDGALIVTTKSSGQRFLYSLEGSTPVLLEYEQSVALPPGFKKAEFKTRGYSLSLIKKQGEQLVYTVSEITDTRSAGGERQNTERSLLISNSALAIPEQ